MILCFLHEGGAESPGDRPPEYQLFPLTEAGQAIQFIRRSS